MTRNVLMLWMRDDQTVADVCHTGDCLAETLRYATGAFCVFAEDNLTVCLRGNYDPDHTCESTQPGDPWAGLSDGWTPAPGDEDTDAEWVPA